MQLIAKLTGVRRLVETSNPKILLLPQNYTRDHCWVDESQITCAVPAGHHKPVWCIIECEEKSYIRRGTETSTTLRIHSIRRIKQKQAKYLLAK